MPLGKKRKRVGFVGTPAWKKRKVGKSSSSTSSVPCGQGSLELFSSNQSEQTSDSCSASYRKIFGDEEMDSGSKDDSDHEMEGSSHELDRGANDKDSYASPTGFRLVDVELLTMAISHTRCEKCKDGKVSLTEDETQICLHLQFVMICTRCICVITCVNIFLVIPKIWIVKN